MMVNENRVIGGGCHINHYSFLLLLQAMVQLPYTKNDVDMQVKHMDIQLEYHMGNKTPFLLLGRGGYQCP